MGYFFSDKHALQTWGVLKSRTSASSAASTASAASAASAAVADDFLIQQVEAMSRVFWGLQARSCAIWNGGIYQMVGLCGNQHQVDRVIDRCRRLAPRLRALENLLQADQGRNLRLADFGNDFFWRHGVIYRELMSLIDGGDIPTAMAYAFKVHCGVAHEKGVAAN